MYFSCDLRGLGYNESENQKILSDESMRAAVGSVNIYNQGNESREAARLYNDLLKS